MEVSCHSQGRFTPLVRDPGSHWIDGPVGLRDGKYENENGV